MTTEFDDRDADVEFLAAYGDEVHVPEPMGPGMTDVPGLARLAASTWLHGTEWSLMTSARVAGLTRSSSVMPSSEGRVMVLIRGWAERTARAGPHAGAR